MKIVIALALATTLAAGWILGTAATPPRTATMLIDTSAAAPITVTAAALPARPA